jgi:hypothetical protein
MAWVRDVATDAGHKIVEIEAGIARLPLWMSWWRGFGRNICFRFENVFFATEGGREIDRTLVEILKEAQNDRQDVGPVAVFGAQPSPESRRPSRRLPRVRWTPRGPVRRVAPGRTPR